MFSFEIIHQSKRSKARVGRIQTPHGIIETPAFVPVATNASIKAVDSTVINQLGVQLLFCNTYHLLLHPGPEVVAQAGGLHRFMRRDGPIITDSGGFQVFSLAYNALAYRGGEDGAASGGELKRREVKQQSGSVIKISEEGVLFRSYRDGTPILLTPESSVQIQKALGADIIIPLDALPPYHIDQRALKRSDDRTHRWEKRSLEEHRRELRDQAMYAVIHGGVDTALRRASCEYLCREPFDGFAIGGSLGKTRQDMMSVLQAVGPCLPDDKPRHLLGIGDLTSLEVCIPHGIDSFDSAYPTKCARHGILLTEHGPINVTRSQCKSRHEPISAAPICREYTAAYLHHLFKAHEPVAHTIATIHNLYMMEQIMARYRELISNDAV
ncbi:MAG: tRNA guanosine(34) transglycosylase Tgt [Candidatus Dependentiae bacterium]|nr:tRNA guanosine(34) transglycosylase Tgt [Candidatus Dependentiae bacterium]